MKTAQKLAGVTTHSNQLIFYRQRQRDVHNSRISVLTYYNPPPKSGLSPYKRHACQTNQMATDDHC